MRILYSLPHPAGRLEDPDGHTVRAASLLRALEGLGHEVIRLEAGGGAMAQTAVNAYRGVVRRAIPRAVALRLRDAGRLAHGRRHGARLAELAEQTRPDVILETHIAFSLSGVLASRATGIPLVLDDVAPSWEEEMYYEVGLPRTIRRVHRRALSGARGLVAVSATMRRLLLEDGAPEEKLALVENGFDASAFSPGGDGAALRRRMGIPGDAVVIGYVGSFQPFHRVDMLVEAFAALAAARPVHLLLVGDGSSAEACRALAGRLGVGDRCTFAGAVANAMVPAHLRAADIAVLPATGDYCNPMKLYEYLALGMPIVAPDQEALREVVTDGVDARLFTRDDRHALVGALAELIDDHAYRGRLSEAAARGAGRHDWSARGRALETALRRAAG
jgi:glycosyltransferase involved in cell wall biosynthesis